MKRIATVLAVLAAVALLGAFSSIVTHGFQELDRVEAERERLQRRAAELEREIERLEATLEALRSDPEAVESLVRSELGWVRPGERVLLLATPTPVPPPSLTGPQPTPILTLPD